MKNKRIVLLIIFLIFIILTLIILLILPHKSDNNPQALINNKTINLELARTSLEQQKGLMFHENLEESSGMLFVFPDEQIRSFWMKNTFIPLDILYIDSNDKIIDIQTAQPCKKDPCPDYVSASPARYVLELNAGYSEKNNIKIGDKISIKNI